MSTESVNAAFLGMVLVLGIGLIYLRLGYLRHKNQVIAIKDKQYSLDSMAQFIRDTFTEITAGTQSELRLSEEEYRRSRNKRLELKRALKGCAHGDLQDKIFVKRMISDLLTSVYQLNNSKIHLAIPFDTPVLLTPQDQFDILLHTFKRKYGSEGLTRLIEKHKLDTIKYVIEEGSTPSYIITADEIKKIYFKEIKSLAFEDRLEIVVQRIYQHYKGFGVIDEIRDMQIDGVSGGVSGACSYADSQRIDRNTLSLRGNGKSELSASHDSVWVFYKGKPIHFSFLGFGSTDELRRVCQNIYKYNYPGQLSEANGYKVNDMKDGSRVVVVRPPFSESWAFFVRKFDLPNAVLEQLIVSPNAQLPIGMIEFLVKGCRITAVTGAQGSGKTTLLMAMVKPISATFTLRVQEMAYELHLRKLYPQRNILSFRETEHITGQQGLDVQKKTDGTVHILGEVATDSVASWMIQMAQVASLFTLFTHHAKTFSNLVESLRNSLLKTGMFHNEAMAESQVVHVLHFDIHLRKQADGSRYIERITECVPLAGSPYPSQGQKEESAPDASSHWSGFIDNAAEYFQRSTDRKLYEARNIIEFKEGEYRACSPISPRNIKDMLDHMTVEDAQVFRRFLIEHWGGEDLAAS
ncbi:ATPase, T2SS/T4P/T4SS family [Paenibacillus lutrae]|uniref:Pilus assembly protein CpaF n=1 Tax=Paenibacillus lutrae TaxID=2078573 RepID=A0A7X3FGM1_9BACL|nr:ATPase, T2SS/T4P/T4SS family [Paenibacillus lutrae]MVO99290.1 pilus assembly protein CpaF [Paenibacillus lutrae]